MLQMLQFFYGITHSYGLAIILLTVVVRLLMHPLTHKQMTSMKEMQKLQPRMKMLQEKYKDDKEKLNQELMRLYRENHVNPTAGCMPLIVQLPIFILLYQAIMNYDFGAISFWGISLGKSSLATLAEALGLPGSHNGFMAVLAGILTNPQGLLNASVYFPNLAMVVLVGFLTWIQQKMTGVSTPQMEYMLWVMPLFMAFICLSLPGGVMLYWAASSTIGVIQQWWVYRKTEMELQVKPALHKEKPIRKNEE